MSVFSKAKKYRKPSRSIDEKLKLLNQDLEKTGVVVETAPANSSKGVYSHTTFENDGDNVPKVIKDEYDPKDSDKKSIGRFFRKPKKKTKGDILEDKMAVLDKEMKKTMPDW